jgi:glutamate/tyrosine decarboxylase-like PLP-dependent enzyme
VRARADCGDAHARLDSRRPLEEAAHAAREWARRHRSEVTVPEIVASAHPAIDKAAHYLGMRVIRVPWRDDFRADVPAMAAAVTPRTVMLYGSAPAYSLGLIDPIAPLGVLAREQGLWLHVDACVGGVLAPFVRELGYPVPAFDLSVPGVSSISADLHKSRYTAKGASVLLFRDAERQACSRYSFDDWPTGLYSTLTLAGTRPGGAIAAAGAVMNFFGAAGYREIARVVMDTRQRLVDGLAHIGHGLRVWGDPELWAVAYGSATVDIHAVADVLTARGWWPGRVREPRGVHLMITPVHAPVIEEYVADVAVATSAVAAAGSRAATAPVRY